MELAIPKQLPVMTLSGVSLFPKALVPLYIFEPRYRQMLADVLQADRMFCLATEDKEAAEQTGHFEPPCPVAVVGVVRASHQNQDETSNLVLQGLVRVMLKRIAQEEPYRIAEIEPVSTTPGASPEALEALQDEMIDALQKLRKLKPEIPQELLDYFQSLNDPDGAADLGIFTFCSDDEEKGVLLRTLDTAARLRRFIKFLEREAAQLEIEKKLLGGMDEDNIPLN